MGGQGRKETLLEVCLGVTHKGKSRGETDRRLFRMSAFQRAAIRIEIQALQRNPFVQATVICMRRRGD
jgi:hypothetical protein